MQNTNITMNHTTQYNDKEQNLPLVLYDVLYNHLQEPVTRPYGIPCFQWIQCVEGTGEIILDQQRIILSKGLGIFLPTNTPHSYHGTTKRWLTHCLCFEGAACEQILSTLGLKQAGVYLVSDQTMIISYYRKLTRLKKQKPADYQRTISKVLYDFLLDLSSDISHVLTSEPATENKVLQLVLQYLVDHYYEPISLDTLAALVNLRKEYLCTLFKQNMQQTIFQHLQTIRIAKARFYLSHYPEKTVGEIGQLCGFESSSYFCKIFKKLMNLTPEDYRLLY